MSLLFSACPPDPNRMQPRFSSALVPSPCSSSSQCTCSEDVGWVSMPRIPWQTGGCHPCCVSRITSSPKFADSLLEWTSTWISMGAWAFDRVLAPGFSMDSSRWSKLPLYQPDKLVTWLLNYIHFLLLCFPAPHSLLLHLVSFLSLGVKWHWLYKSCSEGQEWSCGNSLSFAFHCLHSWGFPVTK